MLVYCGKDASQTTQGSRRSEVVEVALVDTRGQVRLARPIMPIGRISKQASESLTGRDGTFVIRARQGAFSYLCIEVPDCGYVG